MGFLIEDKYTDVVNTGLTYIGYAWPGTKTSEKKWKIKRVTKVGTLTKVEYALPPKGAGTVTSYDIFAWDDRTTITNWG